MNWWFKLEFIVKVSPDFSLQFVFAYLCKFILKKESIFCIFWKYNLLTTSLAIKSQSITSQPLFNIILVAVDLPQAIPYRNNVWWSELMIQILYDSNIYICIESQMDKKKGKKKWLVPPMFPRVSRSGVLFGPSMLR